MKPCHLAWITGTLLLTTLCGHAQQRVAAPVAIDPIFTADPASLTTAQIATLQRTGADWAQLTRYRAENEKLAQVASPGPRVVFMGDSITDAWGRNIADAPFFPGRPYLNRGISGQTTAQMLVRFRADVIDLKPAVVVILAGTNDLAGNTGLSSLQMIEDNLASMGDLAAVNHIRVVLASVLPVSDYPWRKGLQPAEKVRALNQWIKAYCNTHGFVYLDYYVAMVNTQGGLDPALARDGVHPTVAGYAIMAPLAEKSIQLALAEIDR
jgi:lysophospholipase L1-like esterase